MIQEINKQQKEYLNDLKIMNLYMQENNISSEIRNRVRRVLNDTYKSKEKIQRIQSVGVVLDKLPNNLKINIKKEINLEILNRFEFFTKNFSKSTLEKIAMIMIEKCFVTNESIYSQD